MNDTAFPTAQEMFDHLSELVDDEDFVMRAVRTHFPQFRRQRCRESQRALPAHLQCAPRTKPAAEEPGQTVTAHEHAYPSEMARGSRMLLTAIHEAHPAAMKALASQGRQVVYP